jgi:hypothetical protein
LFVVNWRGGIVSGGRAFRALDNRHRQWHEACLLAAVRHAQTPIYFAASRAAGKANRFGRTPVGAWEDVNCSGGWQARCYYGMFGLNVLKFNSRHINILLNA